MTGRSLPLTAAVCAQAARIPPRSGSPWTSASTARCCWRATRSCSTTRRRCTRVSWTTTAPCRWRSRRAHARALRLPPCMQLHARLTVVTHGCLALARRWAQVRVMPACWYVLLRFWLRVDGVLVRCVVQGCLLPAGNEPPALTAERHGGQVARDAHLLQDRQRSQWRRRHGAARAQRARGNVRRAQITVRFLLSHVLLGALLC
jgi:hypothetical protein